MTNVPSKSNGDILYSTDLFKVVGYNRPGVGSVITGASENEAGALMIAADSVASGIIVHTDVSSYYKCLESVDRGVIWTVRVGSATDVTAETSLGSIRVGGRGASPTKIWSPSSMTFFYSGADWSANQFVHVNGALIGSNTNTPQSGAVHTITVVGV